MPETQNIDITKSNFATPLQIREDLSTTVVDRRTIQHVGKRNPFHPDPVYRPPPKPVKH